MDLWLVAAIGLGCGLAATAVMATVELQVWKRWGLRGGSWNGTKIRY